MTCPPGRLGRRGCSGSSLGRFLLATCRRSNREYDKDKYAKCLAFVQERSHISPRDVRSFELVRDPDEAVAISLGDDLFRIRWAEALDRYDDLLVRTLLPVVQRTGCILELGCGYGYNLWLIRQRAGVPALGGEYAPNAIRLARALFGGNPGLEVLPFNYYEDASYDELFGVAARLTDGQCVVLTSHSIEQLPSADVVIEVLSRHKSRISTVFHFESVYELHRSTLIGLMRKRYAEINDYNRDLYSALTRRVGIRLVRVEPDVIGRNPFNATSIVQWEFA